MKNRILLVDCQVFQTIAWHRGMGKYSYELLRNTAKEMNQMYERIYFVFSKNEELAQEAQDALEDAFKGIKYEFEFIDFKSAIVTKDIDESRRHNKIVLNKYVDSFGKKTTDYLILCLFLDNASVFPEKSNKFFGSVKVVDFLNWIQLIKYKLIKSWIALDNHTNLS